MSCYYLRFKSDLIGFQHGLIVSDFGKSPATTKPVTVDLDKEDQGKNERLQQILLGAGVKVSGPIIDPQLEPLVRNVNDLSKWKAWKSDVEKGEGGFGRIPFVRRIAQSILTQWCDQKQSAIQKQIDALVKPSPDEVQKAREAEEAKKAALEKKQMEEALVKPSPDDGPCSIFAPYTSYPELIVEKPEGGESYDLRLNEKKVEDWAPKMKKILLAEGVKVYYGHEANPAIKLLVGRVQDLSKWRGWKRNLQEGKGVFGALPFVKSIALSILTRWCDQKQRTIEKQIDALFKPIPDDGPSLYDVYKLGEQKRKELDAKKAEAQKAKEAEEAKKAALEKKQMEEAFEKRVQKFCVDVVKKASEIKMPRICNPFENPDYREILQHFAYLCLSKKDTKGKPVAESGKWDSVADLVKMRTSCIEHLDKQLLGERDEQYLFGSSGAGWKKMTFTEAQLRKFEKKFALK